MFKKLLSVGGFTLLSRITGFVRDMLLAWILGKGILSDAFFVAFLFPNNFRAIFGEGTLNPAFLPRYAALYARGEKKAAADFADKVFSWQMAVQMAVLALALIFMPQLISLIAPGFVTTPLNKDIASWKPLAMDDAKAARIIRRGLDRGRPVIAFPKLLAWGTRALDLIPAAWADWGLRRARVEIPETTEKPRAWRG